MIVREEEAWSSGALLLRDDTSASSLFGEGAPPQCNGALLLTRNQHSVNFTVFSLFLFWFSTYMAALLL